MPRLKNAYSRLLVDNHITDIDSSFMAKFDPREYVRTVKMAGVDSVMVSACCHNGNCYYPTKIGHQHKNLNGKDIFGEQVKLLNAEDIVPIAYYTVCWHNDSAKNNPEWRFSDLLGRHHSGRYWMLCPNNPAYREFVKSQLSEIVSYDIAGVFIDMTFWPGVCVCQCCREKFGKDIPMTIDFSDPTWVEFQRCREDWIVDFAREITAHIKKDRSDMSVTHQFSPMLLGWYLSLNSNFIEAVDYPSGDFYGDRDQQRLGTKIFSAFTKDLPFEFMTSRCVNLYDHTSTKSEDDIYCSAATTLACGGAYFFIDAINPDGTLEQSTYEKLGSVSSRLLEFKEAVAQKKPRLFSDVGLYFSMISNVDVSINGKSLEDVVRSSSVSNMDSLTKSRMMDELLGTSVLLNKLHIPYRIVTDRCEDLSCYKTIIINDVLFMSEKESERLRQFVNSGGILIAMGMASFSDPRGKISGDFSLADVFGVSYTGKKSVRVNSLNDGEKRIACDYPAALVNPTAAKVLATLSVPTFDPDDPDHFASIHSNPPGKDTGFPALTINNFGKGKCLYFSQSLMAIQQDSQQSYLKRLLKEYIQSDFNIETNLPCCAELTILKSSCDDSILLCIVNYQKEYPNIPLRDIYLRLNFPQGIPLKCIGVYDKKEVKFIHNKRGIEFNFDQIDDLVIIEMVFSE